MRELMSEFERLDRLDLDGMQGFKLKLVEPWDGRKSQQAFLLVLVTYCSKFNRQDYNQCNLANGTKFSSWFHRRIPVNISQLSAHRLERSQDRRSVTIRSRVGNDIYKHSWLAPFKLHFQSNLRNYLHHQSNRLAKLRTESATMSETWSTLGIWVTMARMVFIGYMRSSRVWHRVQRVVAFCFVLSSVLRLLVYLLGGDSYMMLPAPLPSPAPIPSPTPLPSPLLPWT